jgi:hypothetical protein
MNCNISAALLLTIDFSCIACFDYKAMEHEPTLKYAVCRMLTYNLESVLEIVMYIDTDEKQSTPVLGHDLKVIEFLYRT